MSEQTFSPPANVRAAARKALEMRKLNPSAGTSVGWARASQLANGHPVSLNTIKRIKAYFDRHQVDKKGKDWNNKEKPSKGKIMWMAWGDDCAWSWAKSILAKHGGDSVKESVKAHLQNTLEEAADELAGGPDFITEEYQEPVDNKAERISNARGIDALKMAIRIAFASSEAMQSAITKKLVDTNFKASGGFIDETKNVSRKDRVKYNQQCLEILEKPSNELTDEDLEMLRLYSGWGGVDVDGERGAQYDFFSLPSVAKAQVQLMNMLKPLKQGDRILEPSCGNGVFFMPEVIPDGVEKIGVELDPRAAGVASRLTKGSAEIRNQPFELYNLENNEPVDFVIGNAPFGARQAELRSKDDPEEKNLDRYFLKKCLLQLKAGGFMCIQVHNGVFNNKTNKKWRLDLMLLGKFMGALRLPNGAYEHAGSGFAAPDVLIFQRHDEPFKSVLEMVMKHSNASWESAAAMKKNSAAMNEEEKIALLTAAGLYNEYWHLGGEKYYQKRPNHMLGEEVKLGYLKTTKGEIKASILDDVVGTFRWEPYGPPMTGALGDELQKQAREEQEAEAANDAAHSLTNEEIRNRFTRVLRDGDTKIIDGKIYILRANEFGEANWELMKVPKTKPKVLAKKIGTIQLISEQVRDLRTKLYANDPSCSELQQSIMKSLKAYQNEYGVAIFEDKDILSAYTKYPLLNGVSETITLQISKKDEEAGTDDRFAHVLTADVEPENLDDDFNGHRPEIAFLMKYRERYIDGISEDVVIDLLGAEKGAEMLALLFESSFVTGVLNDSGVPVFHMKETFLNGRISILEKQVRDYQNNAPNEKWREKFEQTGRILEEARVRSNFDDIDVKMTSNFVSDDILQQYVDDKINGSFRNFFGAPIRGASLVVAPFTSKWFSEMHQRTQGSSASYRSFKGLTEFFQDKKDWEGFFREWPSLLSLLKGYEVDEIESAADLLDRKRKQFLPELFGRWDDHSVPVGRSGAIQVEVQRRDVDAEEGQEREDIYNPNPLKTDYEREFVFKYQTMASMYEKIDSQIPLAIARGEIPAGTYLTEKELVEALFSGRKLPDDLAGITGVRELYGGSFDESTLMREREEPFDTKKAGKEAVMILQNMTRMLSGAQPTFRDRERKQEFIKEFDEGFDDWLSSNREVQVQVERAYDAQNNDYLKSAKMDYPIEIKGWNSKIRLRGVQWQSIHHMLRNQRGIAALGVGFGKTLAAVGLTGVLLQEKKANRVWVQVPNNKVADWQQEYGMGLPSLNVMAASPEIAKDRSLKFQFYQQMASSGASVLILPESMATEVQLSPQEDNVISGKLLEDQSRFITQGSVKDREKFKNRIRAILDTSEARQAPIPFEAFNCDAIITDELHQMKNLFPPYKARVQGISQLSTVKDSIRGISLLKKYEYLRDSNPKKGMGSNTYGLTATPMTNSPLEFWNMLYHVNAEALRENKIDDLGTFVRQFCIIRNELAPDTTGEHMVLRPALKGFRNLDVLRKVFFEVVDYQIDRAALEKDAEFEFFKDNKGVTFTEGGNSYEVLSSTKSGDGSTVKFRVNGKEELTLTTSDVDQRSRLRQLMAELMSKTGGKKTEAGRKAIYHDVEVPPATVLADVIADLRKQYEEVGEETADESEEEEDDEVDLEDEKDKEVDQKSIAVRRAQLWRDMQTVSLDLEMLDPEKYKDAPNNKLNACVDNIMKHWNETGSGQLVFCDRINASRGRGGGAYNLHNKLKGLLIESGFPAAKIGIINGGAKNAGEGGVASAKEADYIDKTSKDYNSGKLRLLIGNTPCMGEGLNLQADSIAVHHLDVPYRPSDLVQRNGRVDRQGNKQMTTHIYNYTTAGTLDAYSIAQIKLKANWMQDMLESDQKIFEQPDLNALANDPISISLLLAESAGDLAAVEYWKTKKRLMLDEIERRSQVEDAEKTFKAYAVQMQNLMKAEAGTTEYTDTLKRAHKYRDVLRRNPQFKMDHLVADDVEPFMLAAPPSHLRSVGSTLDTFVIRKGEWFNQFERNREKPIFWKVTGVAISTSKVWVEALNEYEPKKDPEDENEELRPLRKYFYVDPTKADKDTSARKIDYGEMQKMPNGFEPEEVEEFAEITAQEMLDLGPEEQRQVLVAKSIMTTYVEEENDKRFRFGYRPENERERKRHEFYDQCLNLVPQNLLYKAKPEYSRDDERFDTVYTLAPINTMTGMASNSLSGPLGEQYGSTLGKVEYAILGFTVSQKVSAGGSNYRKYMDEYIANADWQYRTNQQKTIGSVFGMTPREMSDAIIKEIQAQRLKRIVTVRIDQNGEESTFMSELLRIGDWQDCILEQFDLLIRTYGERAMAQPLMTQEWKQDPVTGKDKQVNVERAKEENTPAHRYYELLRKTLAGFMAGRNSDVIVSRWRAKYQFNWSDPRTTANWKMPEDPKYRFL